MLTSTDLRKIAELLAQLEIRLTRKVEQTRDEIVQSKEEVMRAMADHFEDDVLPLFDKHEKRLEHVEKHRQHPPGQAANT